MRWGYTGMKGRIRPSARQRWTSAFFIILISLSSLLASAMSSDSGTMEGTESILSVATWGIDQDSPAIWRDRVVWTHYYPDPEDPGELLSEICLTNLTSGESGSIPSPLSYQGMPDIWEDLMVWTSYEGDDYEIYLYNLSSDELSLVTPDPGLSVKPKIWGNWIVWQEGIEEESECRVFLYARDTGTTLQLGDISSSATSPDIWEDRVVWEDSRNGAGNLDIYSYNVTTGREIQITTDPFAQHSPAIWGDCIVWADDRYTSRQIFVYDLVSGTETSITSGDYYRERPAISGNHIVYVNETAVSLINLSSTVEFALSKDTTGSSKFDPDIWGDRIVWTDTRNGDSDIYLYTLGTSLPPLNADFTVSANQGIPPLTIAFNDSSSGHADSWFWDFGDGSSSREQDPDHTYDYEGSFTVILTVCNPWQRDAIRKSDLISVGSKPVPAFSQNETSGPAPLVIRFIDESSGVPAAWQWDFGDGGQSDEQNPVHLFSGPGVFDVVLTVTNVFGTASVTKSGLITVVNGTNVTCTFPSAGIHIQDAGELILNITLAGACSFDPESDTSVIICNPDGQTGIAQILFQAENGTSFTRISDDTITGKIGGTHIRSCDIGPFLINRETGDQGLVNFTVAPEQYVPGWTISLISWEGCTPDDFSRFDGAALRANSYVDHVAYSVLFNEDGHSDGPATLTFGISSDWVRQYGWGDNRSLEITSVPPGARVYVDTLYAGTTPVIVGNLSPGPHEILLSRSGYETRTLTMVVRDERDSIHVIRIGDDGSGEVLNTTFIGHDPERNLDFFRAESPDGLSTFGLASLSKSGNVFQMIYLAISGVVGGGSSGGGSTGGNPDWLAAAVITPTPITTPVQDSRLSPLPTVTSQGDGRTTGTPVPDPTDTIPDGRDPGINPPGVAPWGPATMVLLKNLSVVSVVILVTVVFYLRWKRT